MIAPFAKFIDWSLLNVGAAAMRLPRDDDDMRLEEALQLLKGPDFLPNGSEPAPVEFNPDAFGRHFRFPTPRPGECEENNIVYGRLYRCAERWQERPVIILLDGYPAVGYHSAFPLLARRINRAGFNVATLVPPYQLQRRPRRPMEDNCLEFARQIAQGVAEIRALTGWLLDERCPSVALLGVSFGGWFAGLTACTDTRIASVVLTFPAVRVTHSPLPVISSRVRKTFQALRPAHEAMDTTRLNLISSTPVIPKENILLIEGIHDLFAERQPIEELWQKWRQPEIWRLPHGHISGVLAGIFAAGLTHRVLRWLAPRLEASGKNNA
jgi:pimeloyl-ACP methyl ester carboxylesterase